MLVPDVSLTLFWAKILVRLSIYESWIFEEVPRVSSDIHTLIHTSVGTVHAHQRSSITRVEKSEGSASVPSKGGKRTWQALTTQAALG